MGFIELFEIGFFTAFVNFSSPLLSAIVYFLVVLGFVIQFFLRKRWGLLVATASAAVLCEIAAQAITGWDRIGVLVIYGAVVCMLIGELIAFIVNLCKKQ